MSRVLNITSLKSQLALWSAFVLMAVVVVACGPAEQVDPTVERVEPANNNEALQNPAETMPEATVNQAGEESGPAPAYPAPGNSADGYPAPAFPSSPTVSAYPAPEEIRPDESLWFRFDPPLKPDNTTVSGYAPPNLPLAIVDVTFNGVVLGSGISDEDGRFTISVSSIPDGHRIGIALASLENGVSFEEKALELYPYRGNGYMAIPDVGVFFDTVMSDS